eukprot:GEMP01014204.1.p1 GENE.GEMP01014204.1~~GEMP01014204.1.p1  ORF type:complete len:753 (+),score=155.65 GEMP01014204.1:182-2440(+)
MVDASKDPILNYFRIGSFTGVPTCCDASTAICALGTRDGRVIVSSVSGVLLTQRVFEGQCQSVTVRGGVDDDDELIGCVGDGCLALLKATTSSLTIAWKMELKGVGTASLLACAIHPAYHTSHTHRMFFVGTSEHLLAVRRMIFKVDVQIVHQNEGACSHICWKTLEEHGGGGKNLVSWANAKGVKILEATTLQKVGYLATPNDKVCTALSWVAHAARLLCAWGDVLLIVDVLEKVGGLQLLFLQPYCCVRLGPAFVDIIGITVLDKASEEYLSIATPSGNRLCTWAGDVFAADKVDIWAAQASFLICNTQKEIKPLDEEVTICIVRQRTAQEHAYSLMETGRMEEALAVAMKECSDLIGEITQRCIAEVGSCVAPAIAACVVEPKLCSEVIEHLSDVETLRLLAYNTTKRMVCRIVGRLLHLSSEFAVATADDAASPIASGAWDALTCALGILVQWPNEKWPANLLVQMEERVRCQDSPRFLLELWVKFILKQPTQRSVSLSDMIKLELAPQRLFHLLAQKKVTPPASDGALLALFRGDAFLAAKYFVSRRNVIKSEGVLDSLGAYPRYQLTYLQLLAPYRSDFAKYEHRFVNLCAKYEPHRLRCFVRHLQSTDIAENVAERIGLLDVKTQCLVRRGEWSEAVNVALAQGLFCEAIEIAVKAPQELNLHLPIRDFAMREPTLCAAFIQIIARLDLLDVVPSQFPLSLSDVYRELPAGFAVPDIIIFAAGGYSVGRSKNTFDQTKMFALCKR